MDSQFWQDALLRKFSDDCVWHALIPTMMCTQLAHFKDALPKLDPDDEEVILAQKDGFSCCFCGLNNEGKEGHIVIRVLVAKRNARHHPGGAACFVYRTAFNTAIMCADCVKRENLLWKLDSDVTTCDIVFDQLEDIGREVGFQLMDHDLTGEELWHQVVIQFCKSYQLIMKAIGKTNNMCAACKKPTPKARCSGCHLYYYCNTSCSAEDWQKHKSECKLLKESVLFFALDRTKVIFKK